MDVSFYATTVDDIRAKSKAELEYLVDELEAEVANVGESSGSLDPHLSALVAVAFVCIGDYALAEPYAKAALDSPEGGEYDAEMQFALGVVAEKRGDEAAAFDAYEACLAIDDQFWRAMFHVGKIALAYGSSDEAIDYFRRVVAINPDHEPSVKFLTLFDEINGDDDGDGDVVGDAASAAASSSDDDNDVDELLALPLPPLPDAMSGFSAEDEDE